MWGILSGVLSGIYWNILGTASNKADAEKPVEDKEYQPKKLLKTVIIGAIVGVALTLSGTPVTMESVVTMSGASFPFTVAADKIVSIVWKLIKRV